MTPEQTEEVIFAARPYIHMPFDGEVFWGASYGGLLPPTAMYEPRFPREGTVLRWFEAGALFIRGSDGTVGLARYVVEDEAIVLPFWDLRGALDRLESYPRMWEEP